MRSILLAEATAPKLVSSSSWMVCLSRSLGLSLLANYAFTTYALSSLGTSKTSCLRDCGNRLNLFGGSDFPITHIFAITQNSCSHLSKVQPFCPEIMVAHKIDAFTCVMYYLRYISNHRVYRIYRMDEVLNIVTIDTTDA